MKHYRIFSTFQLNSKKIQSTILIESNNLENALIEAESQIKKDFGEEKLKNIQSKPDPIYNGVVVR